MELALRLLRRTVDALLAAMMAVVAAVLVLQVFMRYVLNAALPWPEELAQFLLVALSLLGAYRAIEEDRNIRLDFGPDVPRSTALRLARAMGVLLTLAFVLYLAWGGLGLARATWNLPSTALRVPMGVVYLIIPLAMLLMAGALAAVLRRELRGRVPPA